MTSHLNKVNVLLQDRYTMLVWQATSPLYPSDLWLDMEWAEVPVSGEKCRTMWDVAPVTGGWGTSQLSVLPRRQSVAGHWTDWTAGNILRPSTIDVHVSHTNSGMCDEEHFVNQNKNFVIQKKNCAVILNITVNSSHRVHHLSLQAQ